MTHIPTLLVECLPIEKALVGADLASPRTVPTWLGREELAELSVRRNARGRRQWLGARHLAKQMIVRAVKVENLSRLQILTRDERGLGTQPRVLLDEQLLHVALSITHDEEFVAVALCLDDGYSVGIDLAGAAATNSALRRLWFSPAEQAYVNASVAERAPQLWAVKEAVFKAVNSGEGWNPRHVEVSCDGSRFGCSYRGQRLAGLAIETRQFVNSQKQLVIAHLPRGVVNAEAPSGSWPAQNWN